MRTIMVRRYPDRSAAASNLLCWNLCARDKGLMSDRPQTAHDQPVWLDPAVAELLRADIPATAEAMISAITTSVPEYGSLGGAALESVQQTAQAAVASFIDGLAAGAQPGTRLPSTWRPGLGAWRSGRSLEALQAAFRVAARAAWERIAQTAMSAGVGAETISRLAGSLFAAVEQVTASAADSYARVQADAAGEREANRARLAALLIRDPPADADALQRAAERAGWRLPPTLAVVALGDTDDPRAVATRLGPDTLSSDAGHCFVVPDPDGHGRRAQIDRACSGHNAAVGPAVSPHETLRSLEWARETLGLVFAGSVAAAPTPHAEDNLLALALARSSDLIDALARKHRLDLTADAASRIDLQRTLLTWLEMDRSATAAARVLHLHTQTVRYRVSRARELIGSALDDPSSRFELELVLRARTDGRLR
jgi:PucR C-terminal helix-turn-helix domain